MPASSFQPFSGSIRQGDRPLILFGGGLDSCALVEFYHDMDPTLLYFDYGQKATVGERRALLHYAEKFGLRRFVIEVPRLLIPPSPLTTEQVITSADDHAKNYLPGRNMLFGAMAFSFAASRNLAPIILGASPAPPESAFNDAKQGIRDAVQYGPRLRVPRQRQLVAHPARRGNREDYVRRALVRDPNSSSGRSPATRASIPKSAACACIASRNARSP
jgi:7-cyano-7-deazaguanine synthase in queuosine biosynthesis